MLQGINGSYSPQSELGLSTVGESMKYMLDVTNTGSVTLSSIRLLSPTVSSNRRSAVSHSLSRDALRADRRQRALHVLTSYLHHQAPTVGSAGVRLYICFDLLEFRLVCTTGDTMYLFPLGVMNTDNVCSILGCHFRQLTSLSCKPEKYDLITLRLRESLQCTAFYSITQVDIDSGKVRERESYSGQHAPLL